MSTMTINLAEHDRGPHWLSQTPRQKRIRAMIEDREKRLAVSADREHAKALSRFRGCLIGLAVGDALGAPAEFSQRGSVRIKSMRGGGPFRLRAGEWTDDTSMALCLAASLIACGRHDGRDQLKRYLRWYERGYMSCDPKRGCFDIGNTTRTALEAFKSSGEPRGCVDPSMAGNGSLVRIAPTVMFHAYEHPDIVRVAAMGSSATTHAARSCCVACAYFSTCLQKALVGLSKREIVEVQHIADQLLGPIDYKAYMMKSASQIPNSGHVLDSLEAALWCFNTTGSFEEAVLKAVNLGGDADTIGAITGQLAGAHYGIEAIPAEWRTTLARGPYIERVATRLYAEAVKAEGGGSDCGANAPGGGGFQPGNTCAGAGTGRGLSSQYPPLNPQGKDTEERYKNVDGSWTPERTKLHDEIIAHFMKDAVPTDEPTSYMMGGGAASGKSSIIRSGHVKLPEGHVLINADDVKAQIPEYQKMLAANDPTAAAFVHEESSHIAARLLNESESAGDKKYNVVLDGVGDSSLEKVKAKVAQMRTDGSKVVAHYVTVDTATAVERNRERAKKTGRAVPEDALRKGHREVSRIVPQLLSDGTFDEFSLYDTNGSDIRVIATARGKDVQIHDQSLWDRFLAKGKE